jgi:hypothetical protein
MQMPSPRPNGINAPPGAARASRKTNCLATVVLPIGAGERHREQHGNKIIDRLLKAVTELSQAFALAVPHDGAIKIRDDVRFFQAIRAVLAKNAPGEQKADEELDHANRRPHPSGRS